MADLQDIRVRVKVRDANGEHEEEWTLQDLFSRFVQELAKGHAEQASNQGATPDEPPA